MANGQIAVLKKLFNIVERFDVEEIKKLSEDEIRHILPCLVRYIVQSSTDPSQQSLRRAVLSSILPYQACNSIRLYITLTDFQTLNEEVGRELEVRRKIGARDANPYPPYPNIELEFERNDGGNRCRIVLDELLRLLYNSRFPSSTVQNDSIFDKKHYLSEVVDVLCILVAEMPFTLPIEEIAEALLLVDDGCNILCRLIVNLPYLFDEVCQGLLKNAVQKEGTSTSSHRVDTLCQFCSLNPKYASLLRDQVVLSCKLPRLAVILTFDIADNKQVAELVDGDVVCFVSGILLGNDSQVRNWFAQYLHSCQKSKDMHVKRLRFCLLREVFAILPDLSQQLCSFNDFNVENDSITNEDLTVDKQISGSLVVRASSILRVYCALRAFAGVKFDRQECRALLRLITLQPPPNSAGVRFVVLALCTVLACHVLTESNEHEFIILHWLQSLVKQSSFYESVSGVHASFGEVLLLVAVHFLNSQFSAIELLISSTLGMKFPVKSESLSRMKIMFTQVIFKEQVLTRHAVTVLVTPNLDANVDGFLPIHCIYQLLRMKSFYKHHVQVKDWLYKQIRSTGAPLHSLLPRVVEAFVELLFYEGAVPSSTQKFVIGLDDQQAFILEGFNDEEVTSIFCDNTTSVTCKILMLYYVLIYQEYYTNKVKKGGATYSKINSRKNCSQELLSQLPIRKLFLEARTRQEHFGDIYPMLLRLLVTHHPQLCMVNHWLKVEEMQQLALLDEKTQSLDPSKGACETEVFIPKQFKQILISEDVAWQALQKASTQPMAAMLLLMQLLSMPTELLVHFSDLIIKSLPLMLDKDTPRKISLMVNKLWYKLSTVMSHQLWIPTIMALRPPLSSDIIKQFDSITSESVTATPLIILKCDKRIYRCPPIFELVLHILNTYMTAFRASLNAFVQDKTVNGGNSQDAQGKEGIRSAFINVQETSAIQILLEICLPTEQDPQPLRLSELQEIRSIVCSHLHQVFISYPNIAKLVHFQCYPVELIPMMVSGVPSMHICLDFLPELINQPQLDKQLFGISLASYLAIHYPLQKSMDMANQILEHITLMLSVLPAHALSQLIRAVLPALARLGYAFPPLCEDITSLLFQFGRVMHSSKSSPANAAVLYTCTTTGNKTNSDLERTVTPDTTSSSLKTGIISAKLSNMDTSTDIEETASHYNDNLEEVISAVDILKAIEITFSYITKYCIFQRRTSFNHESNSLSTSNIYSV